MRALQSPTRVAAVALVGLVFLRCGETERDSAHSPNAGNDAGFDAARDTSVFETSDEGADADAGPICLAAPGSASVMGASPDGPLQLGFAAFHIFGGECGGHELVLLPSGELAVADSTTWPLPYVRVKLAHQLDAGIAFAAVTVVTDSGEYLAEGSVTLTATDPLTGTIAVNHEGVTLFGGFDAGHCEALDVFCP